MRCALEGTLVPREILPSGHYYLGSIQFVLEIVKISKSTKLLLDRVHCYYYWSRTICILIELSEYGTKSLRGIF